MQELAGRLTALDPEASATLKVVSYFDTLVGHEAGVETLLRGAAVLSGCPAGLFPGQPGRTLRMSPDGRPLPPGDPGDWPSSPAGPETVVWPERAGRHPSGIVSTPFGLARAEIAPAAAAVTGDGGDQARGQPARQGQAGIGTAAEPARLLQALTAPGRAGPAGRMRARTPPA